MKKVTAKKIIAGVFVAVVLVATVLLVLWLGGFGTKIAAMLHIHTEPETSETTEPADAITAVKPNGGMSAVWIDYGIDCKDDIELKEAINTIADWKYNTVIIRGCSMDKLTQIVALAKERGLYTAFSCDASLFVDGGIGNAENVQAAVDTGIDSVIVRQGELTEREIGVAANLLHEADKEIYVGIQAEAAKEYAPVCPGGTFDYKFIDITVPTSAVEGDYDEFLEKYFDGTTDDTVFAIHTELLGNSEGYEEADEILSQFSAIVQTDYDGYCFYRYSVLKNNPEGLADAIADFRANGIMKDFFKSLNISNPASTNVVTDQSHISFVGTGDINYPLTINGETVTLVDDGYFSVEKQLNVGKNVFIFNHNGKTVTYTVTYNIKLIDSVQPTGLVSAPGGTEIEIVANANKAATVKAVINGSTISLVRSDEYGEEVSADDGSDYTYFIGSYRLPASGSAAKNLGNIKVTASYGKKSESLVGASVVVNAAEQAYTPPVIVPETATTTQAPTTSATPADGESSASGATDSSGETSATTAATTKAETTTAKQNIFTQLTPYSYNGVSGQSKMVVISAAHAETLPSATANDVSVPYFTALPMGTIDYVVGTSSYSDLKYYVLASGRRIYQSDAKYLQNGYNMPYNEIKTVGVAKTANATNITFTMKWKVPFNVRENPQSFYTQTAGRPYSIKSFTAQYVDIEFFYTSVTDSAPQFSSNVVSRAEWIKNSTAGTQTLRLHLKKVGGFYGIKYYYNSNGTITFSIKERSSSSIAGKVIMLDAGHGGNDPGAIGTAIVGSTNIYESTINLALANKVKARLESLGATVLMTRTSSGQTISLDSRAAACRSKNPDIFIAMHCDASSSSTSASGTTAYYYKSYSYPLAKYLNSSIAGAYKAHIYKNDAAMASKVEKGAMFKPFRVTRIEECPSILIEYGFVTNIKECNALINDGNRNILAQATVDGIVNYFKNS